MAVFHSIYTIWLFSIIIFTSFASFSTFASSTNISDYDVISVATACFSCTQNNEATIFSAPKNGILAGITLTKMLGSADIICPNNLVDMGWGCMDIYNPTNIIYHTVISEVTKSSNHIGTPFYPTLNTKDIANFSATTNDLCPDSCFVGEYTMSGAATAQLNNDVTFIGPSYNITTSDTFMLQYLSACCPNMNTFIATNYTGNVCATVDFLYNKSPETLNPTPKPSSTLVYEDDWPILVNISYEFHDLNDTIEAYVYDISSITTYILLDNAYNITDDIDRCIISYTYNTSHVTDTSFVYWFELHVCDEETAILLVDMYNNMHNAITSDLTPEINNKAHLFVSPDDISLHSEEIPSHFRTHTTIINYNTTYIPSISPTKDKTNDDWTLFDILILNVIGVIIGILICIIFYKRNKKINKRLFKYKLRNKELEDKLLAETKNTMKKVRNRHVVDNERKDNIGYKIQTYSTPGNEPMGLSIVRLPSETPALPPEKTSSSKISKTEFSTAESSSSEELYVEMSTNAGGTGGGVKKTGVEGRMSLHRNPTDSEGIYVAGPSYTHDGDPTGDGMILHEEWQLGEEDITLRTYKQDDSDSNQAFVGNNDDSKND